MGDMGETGETWGRHGGDMGDMGEAEQGPPTRRGTTAFQRDGGAVQMQHIIR